MADYDEYGYPKRGGNAAPAPDPQKARDFAKGIQNPIGVGEGLSNLKKSVFGDSDDDKLQAMQRRQASASN